MSAGRFAVPVGMRALLSDLGVAPANVLRRASLPADLLARPSVTLTPEKYFAFFEAIEAEADEPNLPIAIGRAISVEVFDPPIFAALCSPNLIVAAERIAQYKQLIGPLRLNVTQGPAGTKLTLAWPVLHDPPQVLAISELVFWVALGRIATRTDVRPVRVTTASPPLDTRAYEHYLGVAITEAAEESITFSVMDARRPFLTAGERTWEFFEPELRRRLSELDDGASTAERARATLIELLPAGRQQCRQSPANSRLAPGRCSADYKKRTRASTRYGPDPRGARPKLSRQRTPHGWRDLVPTGLQRPELVLPRLPRVDRPDRAALPHARPRLVSLDPTPGRGPAGCGGALAH